MLAGIWLAAASFDAHSFGRAPVKQSWQLIRRSGNMTPVQVKGGSLVLLSTFREAPLAWKIGVPKTKAKEFNLTLG